MKRILSLIVLLLVTVMANAGDITGVITDKKTNEPLVGATVLVEGTGLGAIAELDGSYIIKDVPENSILEISYVAYNSIRTEPIKFAGANSIQLNFQLESNDLVVETVKVKGVRNTENEQVLNVARAHSSIAIESVGAKEMSVKGISNVEDGVKKMTGISIADAGQVFVRGLGDRYSLTALNGLPIASPNPDNKLIPLSLFPSSVVDNITVAKVYNASAFADYAGAFIDISTKDNVIEDYFTISASIGVSNATGSDFYMADRASLLVKSTLPDAVYNMSNSTEFTNYLATTNPFSTTLDINKTTALPDFGLNLGFGKNFKIKDNDLSVLLSLGGSNSRSVINDGVTTELDISGNQINNFVYDSYNTELKLSGLASLGYSFGETNKIHYTLFYSRNAEDEYKFREGNTSEGDDITSNYSVTRIYTLISNQINGEHGLTDKLKVKWGASYGVTSSDEPDRRQVLFYTPANEGNTYSIYKQDNQSSLRYFGEMTESEIVANIKFEYSFGEKDKLYFGAAYKSKERDYNSIRFYYKLKSASSAFNTEFTDIYNIDSQLGYAQLADGTVPLDYDYQPNSKYFANSTLYAAFVEYDLNITEKMLLNLGVRYEYMDQIVKSWSIGATESNYDFSQLKTENPLDALFPALNLKYAVTKQGAARLAFSRTITRPSFIEMAPFEYKESYGSATMVGNADIQNGYNYNADLRYEVIDTKSTDMFSVGAYYKYLDSPIERIQKDQGGSLAYSFQNSDSGMAAGLEVEFRKSILENLRLGFNASYIYTNVVLPEGGGIYTDTQRALQGASPYLGNVDLSYAFKTKNEQQMTFTLLCNVQGPRIDAVGVNDLNNVILEQIVSLDFVYSYAINKKWSMKVKVNNMLNAENRYTQEVDGTDVVVSSYKKGVDADLSFSYKF